MRYLAIVLFVVTLAGPLTAQTRVYLPSSGVAAISPSFSAGWEDTGTADRLALATSSGGSTAQTGKTATDTDATVDTDLLARQYISPPLNGAQTITGTVKGQVKVSESVGLLNARAQMVIYVVSNDGAILRGTLLDFETGSLSSEFSSSNINRKFPLAAISPATLSSVNAQDCDRIVIEYGSRNHSTTTGATINMIFGDDSASELPENETAATAFDPWVEFSGAISFRAEGVCAVSGGDRRVMVIGR